MELSKHKNHRNPKYLSWLRKQPCVASGNKAQCAHHIRLGTNGGSSLKPSDYFCIPLLNEFHTTGLFAIHVVGEDTFLKQFKLNRNELFIKYLTQYLIETFDVYIQLEDKKDEELIAYMIKLVEEKGPKFDRPKKKKKPKHSLVDDEFYQKAKEAKKTQDRELRLKIKEDVKLEKASSMTKSLKGNEYYEKSKELKRLKDKELRAKIKESAQSQKKQIQESEFHKQAKELKRARDKELRAKIKLDQKSKAPTENSIAQSEYHQKAKELKRARDKEFRAMLKAQRK